MSIKNPLWGRRVSMVNCSSSDLRPRSRASPSTWSNDGGRPAGDGEPSCVITRWTLPRWTCSLLRPSVSTCSMPSSSWGSTAETSSGSTSQQTRQRSGLLVRSRGPSLGIMPHNTSSAIGIRSMARLSHADCAPWASGTSPLHQLHLWQNGFAERLIGSIRRECVDHIIVLGKVHLRRILKFYADYYNRVRTHRSLDKDAPVSRPVYRIGVICSHAILGGLHYRYARV